MKELPVIQLNRKSHRGFKAIILEFSYNDHLVGICKEIGAKWSPSILKWYVPDDAPHRQALIEGFKGRAWLRWPPKEPSNREVEQRRQRAGKLLQGDLTESQLTYLKNMERLLSSLGRSANTIDIYMHMCTLMFVYLKKDPAAINNMDIIRFQSEFLVKGGYAESTQRQFASAVKMLYKANAMPWTDIQQVKAPRKARNLPKVLSRPEVMSIIAVTENMKHRALLSLMYSTGIRIGEVLDLRIRDINFERHSIHVVRAKGRKDRVVQMGAHMSDLLATYINRYRPIEFLFNGKKDMQYSATSIRAVLKRSALKAGVTKEVYPHMLRHSFATHMIEDGVNLRYVQELLGHHRPETTQIYTHVTTEHLRKIKNPFDQLIDDFVRDKRIDLTDRPLLSRDDED